MATRLHFILLSIYLIKATIKESLVHAKEPRPVKLAATCGSEPSFSSYIHPPPFLAASLPTQAG